MVSPDWLSETLAGMGQDPAQGVPAEEAARAYVASVTGYDTGRVIPAVRSRG